MKGIIYKICGYGLTYYGSTIQPICERKANHISHYRNRDKGRNYCSSWVIFEKGDDWTLEPIEEIEFNDIDELRLKESEYQKNNDCVNKQKLKTQEEMKTYKREWATQNRRAKGITPQTEMCKTKDPEYKNNWRRNKIANETQEEKDARNAKRRETRKPLTEEQKEKARERARKQRENKKLLISS